MSELKKYRLQAIADLQGIIGALQTTQDFPMSTNLDQRVFECLKHLLVDESGQPSEFYQGAITWLAAKKSVENVERERSWDELRYWLQEEPATMPIRKYYRVKESGGQRYVQISKYPQISNYLEDGVTEIELNEFADLSVIDTQLLEDLGISEAELIAMDFKDAELKIETLLNSFGFKVSVFSEEDWEHIED